MTRRGEAGLAALIYAVLAGVFFLTSFFPDRLFVPMHTDQFAPWSQDAPADRIAALERDDYPHASDKLISFRADDAITLEGYREGRLPLWNPTNACGLPHLAQGLYGVLYPPHWIWRFFAPERAYGFLAAFHHFLAAFFTFLFVRRIGARFQGALLAGVGFAFSLCLLARAHYYQYVESVCWLPLGLLAVESWLRTRSWRALGLLAIVMALILLVGWPQAAAFCGMAFFVSALVRSIAVDLEVRWPKALGAVLLVFALFVAVRKAVPDTLWLVAAFPFVAGIAILGCGRNRKAFFRVIGGVALALGLGALIASIQYLPAAEWMRSEGSRSASAPELLSANGIRPWFLLELIAPGLFGSIAEPLTETLHNWQRYYALTIPDLVRTAGAAQSYGNPLENAVFVGLVAILLAPLGLLVRSPRRSSLIALLVLFLGFALGARAIVYPAYFAGFFVGTDPRRALVIVAFVLSCFAGLGLSHLIRSPRRAVLPLMLTLATIVLYATFLHPLGSDTAFARLAEHARAIAAALHFAYEESPLARSHFDAAARRGFVGLVGCGAVFIVLLLLVLRRSASRLTVRRAAIAMIGLLASDLHRAAQPALNTMPADGFLADHPLFETLRAEYGISQRLARYGASPVPTRIPLSPNFAGCFGLRDAWCYSVSPPKRFERLADSIFQGWPLPAPSEKHPSLVGSVFLPLLSKPDQLTARALDLFAVKSILGSGEPPTPLPPGISLGARVGSTYELVNEDALPRAFVVGSVETIAADSALDAVANQVLDPAFDPRTSALLETPFSLVPSIGSGATLRSDQDDQVVIDLEPRTAPGLLVLLDTFAPGWIAEVDGVEHEILRANCAFRGVPVPAGAKQVVFRYQPRSVRIGIPLSLTALGVALLLLAFGRRRPQWSAAAFPSA